MLVEQVTSDRVKDHFREICFGPVERFEIPKLHALNFLLRDEMDGGGTLCLRTDAQGKTYSGALVRIEIDVPENLL